MDRSGSTRRPAGLIVATLILAVLPWLQPAHGGDRTDRPKNRETQDVVVLADEGIDDGDLLKEAGGNSCRAGKKKGLYLISLPATASPSAVAAHLKKLKGVREAESNYEVDFFEGHQSTIPALGDDPYDKAAFRSQSAFGKVRASVAAQHATGNGTVVAVIDTGALSGHESLDGHLTAYQFDFLGWDAVPDEEANGVDDDGDGTADEARGHGTFAAGLVAALAPGAAIMPIRVLGDDGRGPSFAVADAIFFATANGADVINLSLGLPEESAIVRAAVQAALDSGVVVVAAAGNEGAEALSFPASMTGVVSVTSLADDGTLAAFANYHANVSICAPGVGILGPWLGKGGTTYASWSGTSFSAPMVSAAAALLRGANPTWTAARVRQEILDAAASVDNANPDFSGKLGRGILDLGRMFGD